MSVLSSVSSSALASAQRTFVASFGTDANASNNCSLVLPCRSFATAMTQTLDGGEIVVLDSAGYAPVVVNRSVSIIAPPGVHAGITAFSGDAVAVTGDSLNVALRGLSINSQGGSNGINISATNSQVLIQRAFVAGFSFQGVNAAAVGTGVVIEDSTIRGNFNGIQTSGDVTLNRVRVADSGGSGVQLVSRGSLHIRDSMIEHSGNHGIFADTFGGNAPMFLTVEGSTVRRNTPDGIKVWGRVSPSGNVVATISKTIVSENATGIDVECLDVTTGSAAISDSVVSGNDSVGISGSGAGCKVSVSHNAITGNGATSMVNAGAGSFVSFGDNRVSGNNPDTPSGTVTLIPAR
jgi:hypothetical protein